MDVSFCSFTGRNGWGDQMSKITPKAQRFSRILAEKIPMPVSINDLLKIPDTEEKYKISTYNFSTIKLIGIVLNVEVDSNDTCIMYKVCDASVKDTRLAPTFNVIRYQGINAIPDLRIFKVGSCVQALGKLRYYDNHLSLVSFNIHEIECLDEIESFQLEAQLAKLYYNKNFPKLNINGMQQSFSPLFCQNETHGDETSVKINSTLPIQQNFGHEAKLHVVNQSNNGGVKLYKQSKITDQNNNTSLHCHRGLTAQQSKIYNFIQQYGSGEIGVSLTHIKKGTNSGESLIGDLNSMLDLAVIYSTVDDEHFAAI